MSKFFVVHVVPNHSDDFEVAGIFTHQSDANAFVDEKEGSGEFLAVARPQHLEMATILDMLTRDRLKELADPIAKLAATVPPNAELRGARLLARPLECLVGHVLWISARPFVLHQNIFRPF